MGLVRLALKNPYTVIVFVLTVVVLGAFSLTRIPRDLLPVFRTPAVQIVTLYPGMPPEVVERDIMSRLQRWTGQAVGISHQEAKAMQGVCIVKDFFREDIDDATAMSQVTSLAVSDMFYLPPGTLPPMVMPFDPTASVPLCLLSVSSETMTEKELYDVAYYEMRNRLQAIQGVIAPAVYGGVLRRILTYVDRDKLEARNMSPLDVVKAVQAANPFVPTGSAKMGDFDYLVLSNAMVDKVEELNDIPLRVDDGKAILLRDIGEAKDSFQIQSNIVRINGRRQVYIPIYRQPGANTIEIVRRVKAKSDEILQRLKEMDSNTNDLRMEVVMDQSLVVDESIDGLTRSGLFGALLVAIIVFLFLRSVRTTLIVLVAIPMGVLGAALGMFFTGDTLNSMTLGGLALAIGILVDQAIVVVENIARHMRMDKTRMQAALDGASEVALPVFVSTLTFVVVFFPVVFLTGMASYLFKPLAIAVTFAVVTSYLVAMTFIPVAAVKFLPAGESEEKGFFTRLAKRYRSIAKLAFRRRWLVLAGSAGLFMLSLVMLRGLGSELFPRVDAGQFTVQVRAPIGTRLEKTEELVHAIEIEIMAKIGKPDPDDVDDASELKLVISNIGVLYDWPAAYTSNNGPMDAFLLVELNESRGKTAQDWAAEMRSHLNDTFPGVQFSFDTGGMLTAALNMGMPAPINVQVQGSKLEVAHEIAQAIVSEIEKVEGTVDVRIDQPLEYPAIRLNVDRIKAAMFGLTQEEVIKNVVTAINSSVGFDPSFWIDPKNGNHYFIGAQYPVDEIESFETLLNIPIRGAKSERTVLLKSIATLHRTTSPAVVKHVNITRTVDVFANVADGYDLGSVTSAIEERLASSQKMTALMSDYSERGYRFAVSGEVATMRESFTQFSTGLIIAAILVFLVMVAQLRSFVLPLVVLLTIPLGLIGVVAALWVSDTPLSIPAFMGLILMVGLVVEYSILLVEFTVRRQREGADLETALLDSAEARLRPLLMTSLTTGLALLPMATMGGGVDANAPMARAIIGAVIGGALLTLFVVPALYGVLGRFVKIRLNEEDEAQLIG